MRVPGGRQGFDNLSATRDPFTSHRDTPRDGQIRRYRPAPDAPFIYRLLRPRRGACCWSFAGPGEAVFVEISGCLSMPQTRGSWRQLGRSRGPAGSIEAEHDPGPAEGDLGDQVLEAPVGGGGAGAGLVRCLMDGDLVRRPAWSDRRSAKVRSGGIAALGVVDDLAEVWTGRDERKRCSGHLGGGYLPCRADPGRHRGSFSMSGSAGRPCDGPGASDGREGARRARRPLTGGPLAAGGRRAGRPGGRRRLPAACEASPVSACREAADAGAGRAREREWERLGARAGGRTNGARL